ncbi:MAG: Holliday junction helicase RuvA [Chlorobi bacterium]|jgi:Holliday junction DNA helicase RuvA|nr:Holliday junction helicase RuvA [Chlorobiota bacterium]
MIEYLSGELIDKNPTKAVISASGVGYGLFISLATYERLPEIGGKASLHTYLVVREDALTLFGFSTVAERDLFLLLTSVNGVGPKIAIGILSSTGIDVLKENISRGNAAALTRLPGIGKKIAERVTLELREKIGSIDSGAAAFGHQKMEVREEALAALVALGYNRSVAERAIRSALASGAEVEENVETLIKAALRQAVTG